MNAFHRSAIPHKQLIIITLKSIYFVYVIFNNLKNYMWHWSIISLLDKLTILFIAICIEWFQPFQKVVVQLFPRKAYRTGIEKHFIEIKLNIQQKLTNLLTISLQVLCSKTSLQLTFTLIRLHTFYNQRFFSAQPHFWSTFSWIQSQILLRCSLVYISIIIVRLFLYYWYICVHM